MKNIIPKDLVSKITGFVNRFKRHIAFAALLAVLLVYIIVVWQISQLSAAEPDPTAQASTAQKIPKVDQKAINQIQSLEQNNTQVHTLLDQARNNPFQE